MTVKLREEVLDEAAVGQPSSSNTVDDRFVVGTGSAARRSVNVSASSFASSRRGRGVVRSVFDLSLIHI